MKTAIVTGATGFIGTYLVSLLRERGVEVTEFDARVAGESGAASTPLRADVFYHLAWEGATGAGRQDAVLQAKNAQMTCEALQMAKYAGCGRFIALGTVYEKFAPVVRERDAYKSADFYILSKDYAHASSDKAARATDMDYVWATICHPIGRGIKPEQMMAYAVSALCEGVSPEFGTAQTPYDIIAVEDVALGLYLLGAASELSKRGYYIGSGKPRALREWLEDAAAILDTGVPINFGARPDDGMVFDEHWFDISDLVKDTGFSPEVSFEDAVRNVALS